jgi:hypothetical protein
MLYPLQASKNKRRERVKNQFTPNEFAVLEINEP